MRMKQISFFAALWVMSILLATACSNTPSSTEGTPTATATGTIVEGGSATEMPTSAAPPAGADAYPYPPPLPTATAYTGEYPPPAPPTATPIQAYPPPPEETGTLLAFTEPVKAGDTEVKGVGPAGLDIFVLNTTRNGELLGSGRIGDDGTFTVPVPALEANVRIGLRADPEQQGFAPEEIRPDTEARTVPTVGYFYDTALVEP
jgi:hypothetical protein